MRERENENDITKYIFPFFKIKRKTVKKTYRRKLLAKSLNKF